ncbi:MAG: ABC transporter ATP-binding protein [Lentisphaeria bacterium]|nr:ABC transporter ATP-binding protein [Lentisphaeria bacterium]MDY0177134.1 ABC transporter ATP-binding protein [Lentisphaeria bacterium]NLZ60547.1 ABC transporter ATP-binding protein [Lentisphaerota bacterium]
MRVKVEQLSKSFSGVKALSAVDLEVADGELFFLLGPSGCGKTTLLRCIAGFEQACSGQIYLGEEEVSAKPAHLRNSAMVFQGYALWPHMSVYENISFGLEMRGLDKKEREKRVLAALRLVQIEELAQRKPNALSGGQQQRVALARTLAVEPGCLLLDEPLANLDAKLRAEMRLEIRKLCKDSGLTGIYVTHDRQEALSMADRIAVMHQGEICQIGTPQEIYRRPKSRFVAGFLGENNFIEGQLRSMQPGTIIIDTALGDFRADTGHAGLKEGDAVLLSVRPEAILLGEDKENCLEVRHQQVEYLGELAKHLAKGQDGKTLQFYEMNPSRQWQNGELHKLHVKAKDIVVLPLE